MNNSAVNKKIGTLLAVVFTAHIVNVLCNMSAGLIIINLGMAFYASVNIILDLAVTVPVLIFALRHELSYTHTSRVFSWVYFILSAFSMLNTISAIVFGKSSMSSMGACAHIAVPLVLGTAAFLFFAYLPLWRPLKITCCLSVFPSIVSGIVLYQTYGTAYLSEGIILSVKILTASTVCSLAIYIVALVLSIILAALKPAPSARQN